MFNIQRLYEELGDRLHYSYTKDGDEEFITVSGNRDEWSNALAKLIQMSDYCNKVMKACGGQLPQSPLSSLGL